MGLKIRCSCCDSTRGQHTSDTSWWPGSWFSSKACVVTDRWETACLGSFDLLSCQSSNGSVVSLVCGHF